MASTTSQELVSKPEITLKQLAGHDSIIMSKVSGHRDHRMPSRYDKVDATALAKALFD